MNIPQAKSIDIQRFYEIFRKAFEDELSRKTGWVRIEVMSVFDKAFAIAVIRYANEKGVVID